MHDSHSPCVNICSLDPVSKICVGCGRSLAEIGNWSNYSEIERLKITAQLAERLARLKEREVA
jgi:uncharacterized protein